MIGSYCSNPQEAGPPGQPSTNLLIEGPLAQCYFVGGTTGSACADPYTTGPPKPVNSRRAMLDVLLESDPQHLEPMLTNVNYFFL